MTIDALVITIPQDIRAKLGIKPGFTEIAFEFFTSSVGLPCCRLIINPVKPMFGKPLATYKVSSKGQIRIHSGIMAYLRIMKKEELDIELVDGQLQLVRSAFYQFCETISSKRPGFFSDVQQDHLTILEHDHPDEGEETPNLRVTPNEFKKLQRLYVRLQKKYELNSNKPWVGVPYDPEIGFKGKGLSIFYNTTQTPYSLSVQKLGFEFLPEPLYRLVRDRRPFRFENGLVSYNDRLGIKQEECKGVDATLLANRLINIGHTFGDYLLPEGESVTTVDLYTHDRIIIKHSGPAIEYWPYNSIYGLPR